MSNLFKIVSENWYTFHDIHVRTCTVHVHVLYSTCAIYRLYHAVEVYTGMYKTAETGLETRARSARVSKVSKVLCIPVYTDTAWYKVFMPCRCTARARTRARAPAA